ncbi:FtsX-like permease family protein [Phycicoccus avicenniae]|uniref:FtsX-like permease family protein n=1 Tax=Phycicoccus avicenniae TaxID=2828860 RepID=UPI003D268636
MGGGRRSGAAVRAVLSALVVASALVGPVYGRETLSSVVRDTVGRAPVERTALTLRSSVSSPDTLADVVPDDVRRWFGPPVLQSRVGVAVWPEAPDAPVGHITWRDGACEHVELRVGRCPAAAGEVLVEESLAASLGWATGRRVEVRELSGSTAFPDRLPVVGLRVVGTYRQREDPAFWFGTRLESAATANPLVATMGTLLTDRATMSARGTTTTGIPATWSEVDDSVDLALRPSAVGLDEVLAAGPAVQRFVDDPAATARAGVVVGNRRWLSARSDLPSLTAAVVRGREQVLVTVPLLAGALTALVTFVFWLTVRAAAVERRPSAAVARLRGQGPAGVRRLLLADLLPGVLAGLPLGLAMAAGLGRLAATRWFDPPAELVLDRLTVTVGAAVLVVPPALTWLAVRRVSTEPVLRLLRSVPARAGRRSVDAAESVLAALALAGFVAVATGSLVGGSALAAPLLLALAGGLLAARATTAVCARYGPGRLNRGRPLLGVALTRVGRRGTARWVVPVVACAAALLVFATAAMTGASRAYELQSLVDVGAPTVLDVAPLPPDELGAAVAAVDPAHRTAAPAVVAAAPDPRSVTTLAVDTAHVRLVATLPPEAADAPWERLAPGPVPPRTLRGSRLTLVAESTGLVADGSTRPVDLAVDYLRPDGAPASTALATLTGRPLRVPVSVPIPCADGCRLVGFTVESGSATAGPEGEVTIREVTLDGRPASLGPSAEWLPLSLPATSASASATSAEGALTFSVAFGEESRIAVHQASVPYVIPGLATAGARTATGVRSGTLAGGTARVEPLATVAFLPGAGPRAVLVDLRTVSGAGWAPRAGISSHVLVATADPATVRTVRTGLAARGVTVLAQRHAADVAAGYARGAAGWSLRLGAVLAVVALLAASAAVVAVVGSATASSRREHAALRLAGATRGQVVRVALGEVLPLVVVGVVVGLACGHLAAVLTVARLPLHAVAPAVDVARATASLPVSLAVGAAALLPLAAVGLVLALRAAGSAAPDRLVEPS